MADLYLDSNVFIDIQEGRKKISLDIFDNSTVYLAPLSLHMYFYIYKKKIPYDLFKELQELVILVDFTSEIAFKSLEGPTKDFEDNVQLHSAIDADCDIFYTRDGGLLKMGYFDNLEIKNPTVLS
ncbi:MAG: hypothetical protein Q8P72_05290 [Candidatus Roizmanbacteria bacterium]|nr:hypothetical protein [Candidatus Roizmanbacteria bacterium]